MESAGGKGTAARRRQRWPITEAVRPDDENRPLRREVARRSVDLTSEAFRIASQHLSESRDSRLRQLPGSRKRSPASWCGRWRTRTPRSGEIIEALERYQHAAIEETELSLVDAEGAARVADSPILLPRTWSSSTSPRTLSRSTISTICSARVIFPPRCHGKLGGKSAGLFLAKKIVDKTLPAGSAHLRANQGRRRPGTSLPIGFSTSSITTNWRTCSTGSTWRSTRCGRSIRTWCALFKNSSFPSELAKGLSLALDDLGDRPIIVRSSSLLEDRAGSAFSGKYKSLFLGNQRYQGGTAGGPDGRDCGSLCLDLRPRSDGVPGRARSRSMSTRRWAS